MSSSDGLARALRDVHQTQEIVERVAHRARAQTKAPVPAVLLARQAEPATLPPPLRPETSREAREALEVETLRARPAVRPTAEEASLHSDRGRYSHVFARRTPR